MARMTVLVAGMCVLATAAQAQGRLLELQPGTKVRVTAPPLLGGRLEAVIGSRSADSLTFVRSGSNSLTLPISALETVQVSRGKSRLAGAKRGAIWGAGIGAALGLLAIWGSDTDPSGCVYAGGSFYDPCSSPTKGGLFAAGLIGGTLWGTGIGALVGRERWETLNVGPRVGAVLDRAGRAGRLGLRVGF